MFAYNNILKFAKLKFYWYYSYQISNKITIFVINKAKILQSCKVCFSLIK